MTYGRTFPLWRAGAAAWEDYVDAPFVRALADGTLPRPAFLTYLAQDYLFLMHFARAWALATAKSASVEEMQACSATVHALLHHEMPLHVRLCEAAGIDLRDVEEAPENLAYTRYVLEAGYSGDLLDLLAALAPCVLGYGEIGRRLSTMPHAPDYADWIGTYGSAEYQALCHGTAALIDGAVAHRLGDAPETLPRWRDLSGRFAMATRLEAQFWTLAR